MQDLKNCQLCEHSKVEKLTENAVELSEGKSQARLLGGLGKILLGNLEVADSEHVVGNETFHRTRPVLDRKC